MSRLLEKVIERDHLADLDPASRRLELRDLVAEHVPPADAPGVLAELCDLIDGFGPLTRLFDDPQVTDILINGTAGIWVERAGHLEPTDVSMSEDEIYSFIERVVGDSGGRVDLSRPIADVRMRDGSRLQVILPPLAPGGPLLSIRCFPKAWPSLQGLAERGMFDTATADVLAGSVVARRTILVAGATGTGKTTLLAALLGAIPSNERVVVIEETPELPAASPHSVSLVARPPNVEGRGEVTLADLVRASLRMRPDRIVIGEVRGAEAAAALTAMSTGHEGSLLTIHARSPAEARHRFSALALEGTAGADRAYVEQRVAAAIDIVIHLRRDGATRSVGEITGLR